MPHTDAELFSWAAGRKRMKERSHSGLVHRSRKPEWVNAHRGFESHPLRQDIVDFRLPIFDWSLRRARSCGVRANGQSAMGNWKCSERCRSGLTGSTGNAVCGEPHRGFESHPFRQRIVDLRLPIFDWSLPKVTVWRKGGQLAMGN